MPSHPDLLERWVSLWTQGMAEVWRHYVAAQDTLLNQGRQLVAQTPASEVYIEGHMRVMRYRPQAERLSPIPVLCIPSLINRYYVMDLAPERSLVSALIQHGIDVYMLDWGTATEADRYLTLDAAITGWLARAIQAVQRASGQTAVSLLGYCMGGMMAAIYTTLRPDHVANLINLAGPINYHDNGIYSVWTRPEWLNVDALVDALGNIPAQLLNATFHSVRPTDQLIQALNYWERRHDAAFVRRFAAMQLWLNDPTPFPGELFRQYIKELYQGNKLLLGQLFIDHQAVDLRTITTPTLTIAARYDHIAPWQSVAIFNDLIASIDKHLIVLESGHIGMVIGANAHRQLWPQLGAWLQQRSGSPISPQS